MGSQGTGNTSTGFIIVKGLYAPINDTTLMRQSFNDTIKFENQVERKRNEQLNKSMLDRYNMDIARIPHLSLKSTDPDYYDRTTRYPKIYNNE